MSWVDAEKQKPKPFEMVVLDTSEGIAVGCYDGFGKVTNAIFGFVGTVAHSHFTVYRWHPLPEK
ncbi:hypothetical protein WKG93_08930 [Pantoea agglomerans]|uniref:hypothetical protein n=1 Tax=Enterobacter agglomerans TaxID=549 RepID=UPI0023B1A399|nr:hypothetical protein [Pantoea agglomerans]WEC73620.1 hypothetical protein LDO72_06000 [Pantoea agglomerans]